MIRLLAIALFWFWATLAQAQELSDGTPDYTAWERLAAVAESAVDRQTGSNDQFEALRARIVEYRGVFAKAGSANADRIETLRAQIEALGPVPDIGTEAEELASRRQELNDQLAELQAPVQVAEEAFRRADGLVGEIDTIIRERQTRRLLTLGPSPLLPSNWAIALDEMQNTAGKLLSESKVWQDTAGMRQLRDNAPLVLVLLAVSLVFIARGRIWSAHALTYLRRLGGRGSGVWRYIVSLFRIIIPLVGVVLLAHAVRSTGLAGPRLGLFLDQLPIWAAVLLGFRWLSERLFSRDCDEALITLPDEKRAQARVYMATLSVLFVLRGAVGLVLGFDRHDPATEAVLAFPIVVLIALNLSFIGSLLRGYTLEGDPKSDGSTKGESLARVLRITGTGMIAISIASPGMAAIGYTEAGNALLYPTLMSILLMGSVFTLQRFSADVYCLVTRQGPEGRDALIPVLMGFMLVLLVLPVLALIWGARVADLTELWARFSLGFAIGDTRISPSDFLTFVVIFALGYAITRATQSTLQNNVLPKTRIDPGAQNAMVSGLGYVGVFLSALLAITGAGIDLSSLAIVAGALSVGIGFGLQNIVSNFVSGIILLIERPISEGDWIEVGGKMGYVRDISVRSTRIETFERTDVIVPNADLVSGTVTNYTRGNTVGRLIVPIGVAYGTDPKKVDRILREIAEAQPMVLSHPEPNIVFSGFGADSLDFEIRVMLRDVNWMISVKSDINHAIAERFQKEGIEIPFAQRDVWLRNPEALRGV